MRIALTLLLLSVFSFLAFATSPRLLQVDQLQTTTGGSILSVPSVGSSFLANPLANNSPLQWKDSTSVTRSILNVDGSNLTVLQSVIDPTHSYLKLYGDVELRSDGQTTLTANKVYFQAATTVPVLEFPGLFGHIDLGSPPTGTITTWAAYFPYTGGTAGQVLTTDGGSPAQWSWTTPGGGSFLNQDMSNLTPIADSANGSFHPLHAAAVDFGAPSFPWASMFANFIRDGAGAQVLDIQGRTFTNEANVSKINFAGDSLDLFSTNNADINLNPNGTGAVNITGIVTNFTVGNVLPGSDLTQSFGGTSLNWLNGHIQNVGTGNSNPMHLITNDTPRVTVSSAGAVQLNNYTAGCLQSDGSGNITAVGGSCATSSSPGGTNGAIQFNNGGAFGGVTSALSYNSGQSTFYVGPQGPGGNPWQTWGQVIINPIPLVILSGYTGSDFGMIFQMNSPAAGFANFQGVSGTGAVSNIAFAASGGNVVVSNPGSNFGIGTQTPAVQLHTTGDVRFANFGAGASVFDSSGNISSVAPGTSGNVLTSNGSTWLSQAPAASGVSIVGAFSGSSQTDGASISGNTITFGPADATNPGMVSTGTQSFAGAKSVDSSFNPTTSESINLGGSSKLWNEIFVGNSGGTQGIHLRHSILEYAQVAGNLTSPTGVTGTGGILGNSTNANAVLLATNSSSAANATATGDVLVETGNKTAGTGNSGNFKVTLGTSSGGVQGVFKFLKSSVPSASGQVWTASATDGTGYWATPSASVSLSSLTGAATSNTIDNVDRLQTWTWNSLAGAIDAFDMSSNQQFTGTLLNLNTSAIGSGNQSSTLLVNNSGASTSATAIKVTTSASSVGLRMTTGGSQGIKMATSSAATGGAADWNIFTLNAGTTGYSHMVTSDNNGTSGTVTNYFAHNSAPTANGYAVNIDASTSFSGAAFSATLNNNGGGATSYGLDLNTQSTGAHDLVRLQNTATATVGYGTNILFAQNRTTGGITTTSSISGLITNIGNTSYTGAIVFSTSKSNAAPTEVMRLDGAGHMVFAGTVPTATSCGTGPTLSATATDNAGTLTVGGAAVTSCTLTFANTWTNTPTCIIGDKSTGGVSTTWVESTTTVVITGVFGTNDQLSYHCF